MWCGVRCGVPWARLLKLDDEARLAAFDLKVCASSLLLVQAALSSPPRHARKHGLPMLSKQWRKLSAEVNPREEQRLLMRVALERMTQKWNHHVSSSMPFWPCVALWSPIPSVWGPLTFR